MKYQRSGSFIAVVLSLIIVATLVHATTIIDNVAVTTTTVYCASVQNSTGNGYVQVYRLLVQNGTSFPSVASSGFLFMRTDLNALYFYNGTDWTACGSGSGVPDDDSMYLLSASASNFLFQNGTRSLTANWNAGAYGIYGCTWINSTNINFTGQLWWNGLNRTDLIAYTQDSFNYLVFSDGVSTYARTGNTWQVAVSTIQACVNVVTTVGGSIIVKNGTYSEAVVLKNNVRLVLDKGCVGVTVTIDTGATAVLEDYNSCITWYWSSGVLILQYNNINGLVTGVYSSFSQYWSLGLNRTDAVVNPISTASYIIDLAGSTYRMKNGTTGQIDFQSTNASQVLNFAGGNTTYGTVFIKSNTYSIDTRILLRTGVSWVGEGTGTKLRLANGVPSIPEKSNVFWDSGTVTDNFEIAYLQIDGNAANNPTLSSTANCGCGIYIGRSAANVHIHHVWVHDCDWDGIVVRAYAGYTTKGVWVTDSTVNASGYNDITFWRYNSATASLYDCGAMRNYVGEGTGDYALDSFVDEGSVLYNAEYITFSNNIIGNMTGTTGSITSPYGWTGIRLEDGSNCIVTGNIMRGVRTGIADDFDSHGRNIITNNQILLKDPSVTYAVNGLYITSDNNTIMGNTVVVPSTVTNGTVGIFQYDASYNVISGNTFVDEGSSGQSVGMQEETAGCTHNLYIGNDVSSCDLPIALAGSAFSLIGNIGLASGLDPAANVIHITSAGESLSIGNLVFLNSTGYFKTNAVSTAKMPAIAMATWSGSGGNVLLLRGYFTNAAWSWTTGAILYASNTTAGGMTMTYPSNSGAQVEIVGYAVSATQIYFDPNLMIITI